MQIVVDGEDIRMRIVAAPGGTLESRTIPAVKQLSLIALVKRVIVHLK
ncbi:hypothetical protein [Paraburkholderia graminis]